MLTFPSAPTQPRSEVLSALVTGLGRITEPGTWWNGAERRSMAVAARRSRLGGELPASELDPAALEAVDVMAGRPAAVTRGFVDTTVRAIGVRRYVELLGVVSQTMAMDTFSRLMGSDPLELADAVPGDPTQLEADEVGHSRTWIPAGRFPSPPTVLALVPDEVVAQNDLSDVLYMPDREMVDPDWSRNGMHRSQAELAASAVSHGNECFY